MVEEGSHNAGKNLVAWMPPEDGMLSLEVVDDFKIKDSFKTMSSCDRTKIVEVARNQVNPGPPHQTSTPDLQTRSPK